MSQNHSQNRKSSPFTVISGTKGKQDKVLLFHGHKIRFVELGEAVSFLYKNEERIYPRHKGYMGGELLRRFLNECMIRGKVSQELLKKYRLGWETKRR